MASISTTAQFHRHVVEDVIRNMRAEFANEGLDDQVLDDLKQLWETKLIQSGAYDFPSTATQSQYTYDQNFNYNSYLADTSHTPQVPTISNLTQLPQTTSYMANPYLAAPSQPPQTKPPSSAAHVAAMHALRSLNTQPSSGVSTASTQGTATHTLPSLPTLTNTLSTGTSNTLPTLSNTLPTLSNTMLQNTYGFDSSGKPQQYMAPPGSITGWNTQPTTNTQYNIPNIRQHDGANDEVDPVVAERKKVDKILLKKFARAQKQKSQTKEPTIPQFDGLGDRKTEDDDDDDDDDDEADGSAKGDEELGSDLDDEDEDEEPDTEHIVLCQYEKVTRVKNKRKANLKDGIMHIGGKDYIFSKATGEFDW